MRKLLFVLFAGMLFWGCQKDDSNNNGSNPNTGSIFNPNLTYGTVSDIDGNTYKTIKIGTQTWMAENLKVSRYRNGKFIPNITDSIEWLSDTSGACCFYENDSRNSMIYGRLYNWYAVNSDNQLCPSGWHVPDENDWTTLTTFLGGESVAGGKMKSTGVQYWFSPNEDATNSSGFSGMPGGRRYADVFFNLNKEYYGNWWSSTEDFNNSAQYLQLSFFMGMVNRGTAGKELGFSVRCIKD